ncbi:spore protease YyaC [Dehalobacterium formicoaceticum]|uniref:Spore protease YyaC n=1 Tax=Dehalobacterium formicoaceticum TaxID=51515 RepID=A0ABT1Y6U8_9FIRM|nr:spore protease YyaC [Dehalobacterium formicoaceticum]MCR6545634.1 spore protease YyaC [Dehalobacterium formicoaceticum]
MSFPFLTSKIYAEKQIKCHYENPMILSLLSDQLCKFLINADPSGQKEIAVVCIGTDRATGDCLGPLVGWFLMRYAADFNLYGTLNEPVHANNIDDKLSQIHQAHPSPIIIAIDACLGKLENVGMINLGLGQITPGAGVHKKLPPVGDIYYTGIVNVSGHMEFLVLQNTRLNIVLQMAGKIAESIVLGIHKRKTQ